MSHWPCECGAVDFNDAGNKCKAHGACAADVDREIEHDKLMSFKFPEIIYADADLHCSRHQEDGLQKYIRADVVASAPQPSTEARLHDLHLVLVAKAEFWRHESNDPYNINLAVSVALREVASAIKATFES